MDAAGRVGSSWHHVINADPLHIDGWSKKYRPPPLSYVPMPGRPVCNGFPFETGETVAANRPSNRVDLSLCQGCLQLTLEASFLSTA